MTSYSNTPKDRAGGSHVLYRRLGHFHPTIVRGSGVYLWDTDGRRYLDGAGGAAVVNIGHGVTEVINAMATQAAKVAYVHGTVFTTDVLETYSDQLADLVPMPAPRFYYLTSGSEAMETAIKFARQLQLARGQPKRDIVISRWGSYHGATLGALAVTGKPKMRAPFTPLFRDQPHIPPPYCYRCPFGATYPSCDLACAQALEAEILDQGPDRVAAFIAESVGGATQGAVVPPEGYWEKIAQICDQYGVLLIVDEIMAGFGRTGRWFGIEHFDVRPDIITMGKGSTGGYFPLSITAVNSEHVEEIYQTQGDFIHGGTFSHHAVGGATAQATLDYLKDHDLITVAAERGAYLSRQLLEKIGVLPCVGDIRGLGMLWGIEFVKDKNTQASFPPGLHFARRVCDQSFEQGAIFYPGSGSIDGTQGDHLLVAPPFIITEEEIDDMVRILQGAILAILQETQELD